VCEIQYILSIRCKLVTDSHRTAWEFTDRFNTGFMVGKTAMGQIYLRVDFILLPPFRQQYLFTVAAGKIGQFGAATASDSDTPNY
jgi:hypothetical protein